MWPQYSPWMMKPAACGYWSTLGWPSHGVSSFRSVCGQGQSGGERAEGHGVLQKGETLFTRTFPLFLLAASIGEVSSLPKAARQAIDFSCSDQCPAVTLHDPYQRYSNRWRCSDVYLRAHGAGAELHYVQALLMQVCASIRAFEGRSPHLNGAVNVNH